MNYYRGKEVKIKTKIVAKYFKTYQKTMDKVIKGRETGNNKKEKPKTQNTDLQTHEPIDPATLPATLPITLPATQINKSNKVKEYIKESEINSLKNLYINSEKNISENQLKAFSEIKNNNLGLKIEYENLKNQLQIDNEYYNEFLKKWNLYSARYKQRKVTLLTLTFLDKQNLKNINLEIEQISKALFILFNQKNIIESCLVTPKHFLLDFNKYYQAGLEYELSNNIIQFYKS